MTRPLDPQPALDHLVVALEASCGALVALESISARVSTIAPEIHGARDQIMQTIEQLRQVIDELRRANDGHTSALAYGFVLGAESQTGRGRQVSPRRTA